jgi:hypothetical protein
MSVLPKHAAAEPWRRYFVGALLEFLGESLGRLLELALVPVQGMSFESAMYTIAGISMAAYSSGPVQACRSLHLR